MGQTFSPFTENIVQWHFDRWKKKFDGCRK